jgi:hypothetical protein
MGDPPAPYRSRTARVLTTPVGALLFALLWPAALLATFALRGGTGDVLTPLLVLLVPPVLFALQRARGDGAREELVCDAQGVSVGGRVVIPRAEINNGAMAPDARGDGVRVLLGRKGSLTPSHTLHAQDEAEAHAMLTALGLDAAHSTHVYREAGWFPYGGAPTRVLPGVLVLGLLSFLPLLALTHGSALAMVPAALGMTAFFGALWTTRSEVTVGLDGVRVRWLNRERFCAFADVTRCERTGLGVALHRRDGTRFAVDLATMFGQRPIGQQDRAAVVTRIEDALAAHRRAAAEGAALDPAALARDARSTEDWLDALRSLRHEGSHRAAAVRAEDLWRIVADPDSPAASRAAAAVVLAPTADASGKARLRIAAETTASPPLREAIEAAMTGDEPRVAASLDALSPRG